MQVEANFRISTGQIFQNNASDLVSKCLGRDETNFGA